MLILTLVVLMQISSPLAIVDDLIRDEQDIVHYDIALSIPDSGTVVSAAAQVRYVVHAGSGPLVLDFDNALAVDSVHRTEQDVATAAVPWSWNEGPFEEPDELLVEHWGPPRDTLAVTIYYRGAPSDGLVIGDNVHGRRTAFADNWPERAHHWFPCEDHPGDKATVQFSIEVPLGWRAVANGRLLGVDTLAAGRVVWRWREDRPIPVHTMVVGTGVMSVALLGHSDGVPQTAWTFPEDSAFAVQRPFRRANEMVAVMSRVIGAFPYAKLAHVQSSTRYGGMENSSAIFYAERGYANRTMGEAVVAHEIAHQWFGDAVSQGDWHHLWLSEGFASYFGPLFYELIGEAETFADIMRSHRTGYMQSSVVNRAVIDTAVDNPFELLDANNYQKGAWVLHMLRSELGDSLFFAGIGEYYQLFRDSTVLTNDFAAVMSRHANRPMDWFFEQWLLRPGYPQLEVAWSYSEANSTVVVAVHQVQPRSWEAFRLRLPVLLQFAGGVEERVAADVSGWADTLRMRAAERPTRLILDPEGTLLMSVSRLDQRG
ncbi:MAG: M1 family metallopeptidase [Gemmatimonadota bacterium]|nr:MAG: M1 family metallopeptidase [Gemmatimonadota bacterium]